jgi:8-oxo-dGTP pyrophosphatase MutT (NUDIX family)
MTGLIRHVKNIQNVTLPGDRLAFEIGGEQVGWVPAGGAAKLLGLPLGCTREEDTIKLPWPESLPQLARGVAATGTFKWRDEPFDVRAEFDGKVLATIDRGALPWFGIRAEGVHVNGVVHRRDGMHLWIARRAMNRLMDPGKLDHLFAGGIAAGMDAEGTLVKEAAEEAGLSREIVDQAVYAGSLRYTTRRPEGLRRDRIHCYDLVLPEEVEPVATDGEVEAFELWPIAYVIETLRETDGFKFNVALVLIDFLLRWGLLPDNEETRELDAIFRK